MWLQHSGRDALKRTSIWRSFDVAGMQRKRNIYFFGPRRTNWWGTSAAHLGLNMRPKTKHRASAALQSVGTGFIRLFSWNMHWKRVCHQNEPERHDEFMMMNMQPLQMSLFYDPFTFMCHVDSAKHGDMHASAIQNAGRNQCVHKNFTWDRGIMAVCLDLKKNLACIWSCDQQHFVIDTGG